MKIIILGAKGMLGCDLAKVFEDKNPILWDKEELDITNRESVFEKLLNLKPDIVINSASYTDVDGCETSRELAMNVNGYAVGYLASVCQQIEAFLIHYSTDYVFEGGKKDGYKEDDTPGSPLNIYGESKLLGEKLLQDNCENYYLIRTSWLFGKNGKNFVETMLNRAKERDEIKVVNDQHGKPTCTLDLARRTREIVEKQQPFGIYHITNEGETTWFDFACEILHKAKELGVLEKSPKLIPCTSGEFPRPAKRPAYSILCNTKISLSCSWQKALGKYLS